MPTTLYLSKLFVISVTSKLWVCFLIFSRWEKLTHIETVLSFDLQKKIQKFYVFMFSENLRLTIFHILLLLYKHLHLCCLYHNIFTNIFLGVLIAVSGYLLSFTRKFSLKHKILAFSLMTFWSCRIALKKKKSKMIQMNFKKHQMQHTYEKDRRYQLGLCENKNEEDTCSKMCEKIVQNSFLCIIECSRQ